MIASDKANIMRAITNEFVLTMTVVSYLFVFVVNLYADVDKAKLGQADKVFDKAFLQSVKDVLTYEQLVRIVGTQGEKVGSNSLKIPGDKYHWCGRENSSFNIRVNAGKVIDANVATPDGRVVSLEKSLDGGGEINELGNK